MFLYKLTEEPVVQHRSQSWNMHTVELNQDTTQDDLNRLLSSCLLGTSNEIVAIERSFSPDLKGKKILLAVRK